MSITVRIWPSKMGCDVRCRGLHLEVWEHGGVRRLVPDAGAPTGHVGTHYARVDRADFETMARAAVALWREARGSWSPCE